MRRNNTTLFYLFHLGTPPVERKTDTEAQTTTANVKTTEEVHIIVEKETSPIHTPEPTTLTPKQLASNMEISTTPSSTEKTSFVVKVEVEKEQKAGGAEEKLQEEAKEKPEGVVVVQKVTEEVEEKEQKSGFRVEKITSGPKSSTESEPSEVIKVERVPSKLDVETKRSSVQRIEEDEDLKQGKIEPTEPTLTPKKQETNTEFSTAPSSTEKTFVVKVEVEKEQKAGGAEEKLQENKEKSEGVVVVQKVTEEVGEKEQKSGFKVEKITSSPKSSAKSTQSEVIKVERVPSKLDVETKRSSVQRIEEDEDLKQGKIEPTEPTLTPIKQETNTEFSTTPSSTEKTFVVKVEVEKEQEAGGAEEKLQENKEKSEGVVVVQKVTEEVGEKEEKSGFKVEKITSSPKSSAKSTQSEVIKVERVPSKLDDETKRSSVQRIEEDEDLKQGKIEVTVEKESTETSSAKESSFVKDGQEEIVMEVKKVSPSTDETDEWVEKVEVIAKPTVKPTATKEAPISQSKVEEVSISVEKITPSQLPTSGKSQASMVKVVKVTSEDEDLETSLDAVNYKRSDDASAKKTSESEEEALELELEGGQNKIDEQKLAQELDKALEAERNGKENLKTDQHVELAEAPKTSKPPQVTTGEVKPTTEAKGDGTDKLLEKLNVEAAPEKVKVRKVMSDEEMELDELAQETMNDEDKEEVKTTKKPTTATSQEVVIKVEKVPKVTVQVTKEKNENLLSEEETAEEEKELKVELANELEQEKEGVSSRN